MIAWARFTVALKEEAQNRLIVAPAALSGNPAPSAAHLGYVSHALMGGVDAAGDNVLDLVEADTDAFASALHRHAEQVVKPDVRQRTAIPGKRRTDTTENECLCHH